MSAKKPTLFVCMLHSAVLSRLREQAYATSVKLRFVYASVFAAAPPSLKKKEKTETRQTSEDDYYTSVGWRKELV